MWYTAHAVVVLRLKEGAQDEFRVWENIFLVKAESEEEALKKAEIRSREDEGEDGLTLDGQPAEFVFLGLRKLVRCVDGENRPTDGTEVTYNTLFFANQQALDDFVAGKEACATFDDEKPDEEQTT